MNLGLNLFSVRNLIRTEEDFLNTACVLKDRGYSYFQYSGAAFDAERIRRVTEETGVPVCLTHVPMDRIISDTEKLMKEHGKFGCKNIGLGMMPLDIICNEQRCKEKIGELERAAEKMEKNGYKFFYHHHFFEFIKYDGKTVFDYMLENAPHIHFTVDTYWLQYGGADVLSFIGKLKGRMECVHLKDYKIVFCKDEKGGYSMKPAFAPLGEGNMDFPSIIAAMKKSGAEYYFVEQDDAADLPDTLAQVTKSVEYAKRML